jgi:hypothetical protein
MKLRITLLLLALAFLVASHPSFSAPLTSTGPALCSADSSAAELPFLSPSASESLPKSIGPFPRPKCGSCSETVCRGATQFEACGVAPNGHFKYCVDFGSCPADGLLYCICNVNLS